MSSMLDVFEKTQALANAMLESDEYKAMKASEEEATADPDAAKCMADFIETRGELEEMLQSESPDQDELQKKSDMLEELQGKMQEIPSVVKMMEARQGFSNLVSQVNQIISTIINGQSGDEEGCSGSCDSCGSCGGGCGHVH